MNEVTRCTGHCCEDFTLPFSPMQFAWWAKLLRLGKLPTYWRLYGKRRYGSELNKGAVNNYNPDEIRKVSEMIIFKYSSKTCLGNPNRKIDHELYHYTCKHFNKSTGNCMNYENRPGMCRDYPNTGTCKYKGCTRTCEKPCSAVESTERQKEQTL